MYRVIQCDRVVATLECLFILIENYQNIFGSKMILFTAFAWKKLRLITLFHEECAHRHPLWYHSQTEALCRNGEFYWIAMWVECWKEATTKSIMRRIDENDEEWRKKDNNVRIMIVAVQEGAKFTRHSYEIRSVQEQGIYEIIRVQSIHFFDNIFGIFFARLNSSFFSLCSLFYFPFFIKSCLHFCLRSHKSWYTF